MSITVLTPELLSKMFLAGAKNLELQKEHINELNVFPVPDGDTGTNMTLTVMSAAKEVHELKDPSMQDFCKAVSSGSLRGARGNSGVILSQLFRGFTKVAKNYDEIDVAAVSAAAEKAVETAYKAVMQPKEGTILTVAKAMGEKTRSYYENGGTDIEELIVQVMEHAKKVLDQTPDMLPVLKEAGVVDSGGAGLIAILEGFYDGLMGKGIEFTLDEETETKAGETRKFEEIEEAHTGYLYHTTVAVLFDRNASSPEEKDILRFLRGIGSGEAVTVDGKTVNIAVNTNDPGMVLQKAVSFGELLDVTVVNRRRSRKAKQEKTENKEEVKKVEEPVKQAPAEPEKETGFVTVAAGAGISEIFKNLGADAVIEGGQTMNPSTDDILTAVSSVNAKNVFVLPNNKNIIMAAEQAGKLCEDKNIIVIPSKTIPQGITALIAYVTDADIESNKAAMTEAVGEVKTGEITYAVRDTSIDGIEIHEGDFMAVGDGGILADGKDITEVMLGMLEKIKDDSTEVISIYYGSDVTEADAEAMKEKVVEKYPDIDVEIAEGGQPVYYYIVSAE